MANGLQTQLVKKRGQRASTFGTPAELDCRYGV